jgi:hypothetical protein
MESKPTPSPAPFAGFPESPDNPAGDKVEHSSCNPAGESVVGNSLKIDAFYESFSNCLLTYNALCRKVICFWAPKESGPEPRAAW